MKKTLGAALIALTFLGAGCFGGAPSPSSTNEPKAAASARYGSVEALSPGESASYNDGLIVTLERIDDSRCKPDVQCVWQGEVAATLTVREDEDGEPYTLALGTVRSPARSWVGRVFSIIEAEADEIGLLVTGIGAVIDDAFIRVTSPAPGSTVASPLTVSGQARGNWFFEASFPVKLYDANGNLLVAIPAQATADWMTTEFVPFEAVLEFAPPSTETGLLVFEKDNPSGLPEFDDSRSMPVKF